MLIELYPDTLGEIAAVLLHFVNDLVFKMSSKGSNHFTNLILPTINQGIQGEIIPEILDDINYA